MDLLTVKCFCKCLFNLSYLLMYYISFGNSIYFFILLPIKISNYKLT